MLKESSYQGAAIASIIEALAALRLQIFYEFPYLYEGDLAYEREYLGQYAQCPEAAVFGLWAGDELVGATTCLPLAAEPPSVWQSFAQAGLAIEPYFYFGESLLLPPYRGQGWGHRFFDLREAHALSLGYTQACFCAVIRPENHPLRPLDYRPHDAFWQKRGYTQQPQLLARMSWPDREQSESSEKNLRFWTKPL